MRGRRASFGTSGMTLVEVMVSFGIFALAATGVVASLIQVQKLSHSNLSQGYAYTAAQSVMEEIIRIPPARLADPDETSVTIKLATLTASNFTSMSDFTLPWSTNASLYSNIGTTPEGILTDAAYIADSNTIRTRRFMPMRVNLEREIEADNNRVRITLRYQWAIPDRKAKDGSLIYHSGALRTVRSTALRF
jgi:type II secretory pathway pseudopilin PulG